MVIYMAVTMDKYELPIALADSAVELAKMCNTSVNNIYSCISKVQSGKYKKSKFIKVKIEEV